MRIIHIAQLEEALIRQKISPLGTLSKKVLRKKPSCKKASFSHSKITRIFNPKDGFALSLRKGIRKGILYFDFSHLAKPDKQFWWKKSAHNWRRRRRSGNSRKKRPEIVNKNSMHFYPFSFVFPLNISIELPENVINDLLQ